MVICFIQACHVAAWTLLDSPLAVSDMNVLISCVNGLVLDMTLN